MHALIAFKDRHICAYVDRHMLTSTCSSHAQIGFVKVVKYEMLKENNVDMTIVNRTTVISSIQIQSVNCT